jgi:LytS/YehU family sensor histidine kinase
VNYQRIFYWILQIVGWFGLSTLLYIVNRANNVELDWKRLALLFLFALNGILLSHALRSVLLKLDIMRAKSLRVFFIALLGCIVAAILFQFFYEVFQSILTEHVLLGSASQFFAQSSVMFFVFISWSLIYFVNHYFRALRKNEMDKILLNSQKQQIELALMRSQLNPHFLFNSLNSIRALISEHPQDAKTGITKLSNILRNILIFSRKDWVSMAEEMAFVRDYIDLEKIRFEQRLRYRETIEGNMDAVMIPPMTIQCLVENAVKHGINNLKNGGCVEVVVRKSEDFLLIEVINDGSLQQQSDTGVGIANTIHRLRESFKKPVSLNLTENANKVSAKILIPLE